MLRSIGHRKTRGFGETVHASFALHENIEKFEAMAVPQGTRNRTRQKVFLNTLKQLANELGIPIVLIGTREALRVIQTDPQLGSRFEPFAIPRWQPNEDYARFVNKLFAGMGMKPGATLAKKVFIAKLHSMSEGLAGETKSILVRAAERAVRTGRETLDMKALDAIEWTKPSERRKKAEKI